MIADARVATLYRLLTGRPLLKAEQLGFGFGEGAIKQSGKNRLGVDKRGRTHWITNVPAPIEPAPAPPPGVVVAPGARAMTPARPVATTPGPPAQPTSEEHDGPRATADSAEHQGVFTATRPAHEPERPAGRDAPAGGGAFSDATEEHFRSLTAGWPRPVAEGLITALRELPPGVRAWIDRRTEKRHPVRVIRRESLDDVPEFLRAQYATAEAVTVNGGRIEFLGDNVPNVDTLRHEMTHMAWAELNDTHAMRDVPEGDRPRVLIEEVLARVADEGAKILTAARKTNISHVPESERWRYQIEARHVLSEERAAKRWRKRLIAKHGTGPYSADIIKDRMGDHLTGSLELSLMIPWDAPVIRRSLGLAPVPEQIQVVGVFQAIARAHGVRLNGAYAEEEVIAYHCGADPALADRLFGGLARAEKAAAAKRAVVRAEVDALRDRWRRHEAWCEDFAQQAVQQRKPIRWDSSSGLEYLLVTPDTHPDSLGWRVTRFDPQHGPTGHVTGTTPGKALLDALTATQHRDEVRLVPAAEFDAMTRTPEFLHGMRRVGLLQQLNRLASLASRPENEPKQEQLAVHWRQASDALAAQDLDTAEQHLRAGLEHGRIVKAVLFCKARRRDVVTMPRDELIEEHEHLLGVLRSPSRTDDRAEAKKQARELAAYRRGKRKRLVLKAHVKAFSRTDPRMGRTVQVREHEDKRMAARPTMGTPRQPAAAPAPPAPRYPAPQQQTPQHRYATIHTAGPDSPGHAVRLQPHPQKAGVWQLHPDDKERVRHLMTAQQQGQQGQQGQQPAPEQQAAAPAPQAAPKPVPLDELCGTVQGCEDNAEVGGRVPKNIGVVRQLVTRARATVAGILGNIGDDRNNAPTYRNAAGTVDELLADAKGSEQSLRDIVGAAADASGGEANFGPGGKFALKSADSLRRKVKDRVEASGKSEADVVANISDAVRGTVICDRPDQLRKSIEALRTHVQKVGGEVFIDNKWDEDHPFGYAGVHADLHIPTGKSGRRIRAEVQLHLRTINDGTMECVKEQSHRFYEKLREPGFHHVEAATGASLLMYLSAMQPFAGA